jgi:hypothetical protein
MISQIFGKSFSSTYQQYATPDILSENFTSTTLDTGLWWQWLQNTNCNASTTMAINANGAYTGSYGLDIHYVMDDVTRGDCLLHQDNNSCIVHDLASPTNHIFVRGYFQVEVADLCASSPYVQRKLIYIKPVGWGAENPNAWALMVNSWPWVNCAADGYNVSTGYGSPSGQGITLWGDNAPDGFVTASNHFYGNAWYYLEIEILYGETYGTDTYRIWLAPAGQTPVKILDRNDLTIRSTDDVTNNILMGSIEIGRQIDLVRTDFAQGANEHRYWDNLAISSQRIGPI